MQTNFVKLHYTARYVYKYVRATNLKLQVRSKISSHLDYSSIVAFSCEHQSINHCHILIEAYMNKEFPYRLS